MVSDQVQTQECERGRGRSKPSWTESDLKVVRGNSFVSLLSFFLSKIRIYDVRSRIGCGVLLKTNIGSEQRRERGVGI